MSVNEYRYNLFNFSAPDIVTTVVEAAELPLQLLIQAILVGPARPLCTWLSPYYVCHLTDSITT